MKQVWGKLSWRIKLIEVPPSSSRKAVGTSRERRRLGGNKGKLWASIRKPRNLRRAAIIFYQDDSSQHDLLSSAISILAYDISLLEPVSTVPCHRHVWDTEKLNYSKLAGLYETIWSMSSELEVEGEVVA